MLTRTVTKADAPSDDEIALEIGRAVLALSNVKFTAFRLHVWHTNQGVQANVETNKDGGWTVTIRRRRDAAILEALRSKLRVLRH